MRLRKQRDDKIRSCRQGFCFRARQVNQIHSRGKGGLLWLDRLPGLFYLLFRRVPEISTFEKMQIPASMKLMTRGKGWLG